MTIWCLKNKWVPEKTCDISWRNVQQRNNQSQNIMWCVSRVLSHSGFIPGVNSEPFPVVCGGAGYVSEKCQETNTMGATVCI